MKIVTKTSLVIITGILLAAIASAQPKTLIYTDHEPLGNMRTRFIDEVFFPAIEKESNGRLKIEAHWNGELSSSYDALRNVAKNEGKADMAVVVPEYTPNELPLHQIFKSFPVGPSGERQVRFFQDVYKEIPAFSQELENANIERLFFCTGYPVAFFSAKPVDSLGDIRGKKWRTASFWHRDFLKNAGAIPVSMPWNDGIFKALRDGILDGLMVNIDSGYDLKAHTVAPNILVSKRLWLGHLYLVVMNKNTWDALPKEDQQAIQRAAEAAYKRLGTIMDKSLHTQVEDLKKAGATVRTLKPAEVDTWKTDTDYQTLQAAWVNERESKGVKEAGTAMEKVRAIMNE